jgi:hypothetical protein
MAPTTPPTTPPMIFLLAADRPLLAPPSEPPLTRPGVPVTVAKPVVLATTLDDVEVIEMTLPSLVVT